MGLSGRIERWQALSLAEQGVWTLVAWLLWAAMGLEIVLKELSPQLATDAYALRQSVDGTLPRPRYQLSTGNDPWRTRWYWEERWHWGGSRGLGWRGRPDAWYRLVPDPATLSLDEAVALRDENIWREVVGPRQGAFNRRFHDHWSMSISVPVEAALYSAGPNGKDDGGLDDDVFARAPGCSTLLLAWHRETALTLALLLAWLVPWIRLRRSPSLVREFGRALVVSLPPLAVVLYLIVRLEAAGGSVDLGSVLPSAPHLPWYISAGGSVGAGILIAALALRLSRPHQPEPLSEDVSPGLPG